MSFRLMTEVLDCENLGPTEKLVMVCLARHVNEQTGKCFPSVERLMQCSGLGERAVQTNIKELVKRGFITIAKGGGRGRANEYVLSVKGASKTPFEKPCISNPVLESINPAFNALNPALNAPQQRMNIEEHRTHDDSSARVMEILHPREVVLEAMGLDRSGVTGPNGRVAGNPADLAILDQWLALPAMNLDHVCAVIREVMGKKRGGPPSTFSYFTGAMRERSGALTLPPLEPIQSKGSYYDNRNQSYNQQSTQGQRGSDPALENIARIVGLI